MKRSAFCWALLLTSALAGCGVREEEADDPPRSGPRPPMPAIREPVLFDTAEADRILEALQVFPPDDPWNEDISAWPLHPRSQQIIASIGAGKPLGRRRTGAIASSAT
jgi:hypothetical protein